MRRIVIITAVKPALQVHHLIGNAILRKRLCHLPCLTKIRHGKSMQILGSQKMRRFLYACNHIIVKRNISARLIRRQHTLCNQALPVIIGKSRISLIIFSRERIAHLYIDIIQLRLHYKYVRRGISKHTKIVNVAQDKGRVCIIIIVKAAGNTRRNQRSCRAILHRHKHTSFRSADTKYRQLCAADIFERGVS